VTHKISVKRLVFPFSDAEPADNLTLVWNLVSLEHSTQVGTHLEFRRSCALALCKRHLVLPQNLDDFSGPPEVFFAPFKDYESLRPWTP
jgi:hypothetical protein